MDGGWRGSKSMAASAHLISAFIILLLSLNLLIIIIIPQPSTTAAAAAVSINYQLLWIECPINGTATTYAANSTYKVNLDNLLASIVSAAGTAGYRYDSVGLLSDQVFGLAQCRGNETSAVCKECLSTAAHEIVRNCSRGRSAVAWYEECFLRYSDQGFYSPRITDIDKRFYIYLCNAVDAPSPQAFNRSVVTLLDGLASSAAYNSSEKFAYGSTNATASYTSTTIYGLVQCTRDLSAETCYICLITFNIEIMKSCGIKWGARIFGFNCYIRYEAYDFAISDGVPPATPPSSSPPLAPPTNVTNQGKHSDATKRTLAISIPLVAALFLIVLAVVFRIKRRKQTKEGFIRAERDQEIDGVECLLFGLDMLRHATDDFSDVYKLGEGGFGPVYKGTLQDGEEIAIKRLSRSSGQGLLELKNEIDLVVKLQHRNLVKLLGCCLEGEEMLLVYEYLPNTSLDKIIFDSTRRVELDWARRCKIIEGISRGLLYLHEDSRLKIIHRDLKLSNILLDKDMNPKISDFGMAKLFSLEETEKNTHKIVGTYGYMAPEYAMHGFFSTKSDVFSYGVMVLEIVTGRKNSGYQGNSGTNLLGYVWQHWTHGTFVELIDQTIVDTCHPEEAMRCICIGLLCVQEDPAMRPNMENVVFMLKNHSISLPTPSAPPFFIVGKSSSELNFSNNSNPNSHRRQSSKGSRSISLGLSNNIDVSISMVEPR